MACFFSLGIGLDAAKFLTSYQATSGNRIVGVGIDTASIDVGNSHLYETHVELFTNNIYGIENVANLFVSCARVENDNYYEDYPVCMNG